MWCLGCLGPWCYEGWGTAVLALAPLPLPTTMPGKTGKHITTVLNSTLFSSESDVQSYEDTSSKHVEHEKTRKHKKHKKKHKPLKEQSEEQDDLQNDDWYISRCIFFWYF